MNNNGDYTMSDELERVDLLDVLMDPDNTDPLIMLDGDGNQLKFEQVCVIPLRVKREDRLYCILRPLTNMSGIKEDEAIVFLVDTDDEGDSVLRLEEDEATAIKVFSKYYDLLIEHKEKKKKKK